MATSERRTWPSLWRPCSMATETSTMTAHTRATAHVGVDGRSRPPPPPAMCRPLPWTGAKRSEATSRPRAEEAGCWCALALAGTHVECRLSVAGERAEQTSARCSLQAVLSGRAAASKRVAGRPRPRQTTERRSGSVGRREAGLRSGWLAWVTTRAMVQGQGQGVLGRQQAPRTGLSCCKQSLVGRRTAR